MAVLYWVVRASPRQYGWRRPTWTRELLVETMVRQTGVRVHVTTIPRQHRYQRLQPHPLSRAGRLVKVEGAGHLIHLYRPDRVALAIRDVVTTAESKK